MPDYLQQCTPYGDYEALFRSPLSDRLGRLVWRNPVCTPEEIAALKSRRPRLQLLVVRWSQEYV